MNYVKIMQVWLYTKLAKGDIQYYAHFQLYYFMLGLLLE